MGSHSCTYLLSITIFYFYDVPVGASAADGAAVMRLLLLPPPVVVRLLLLPPAAVVRLILTPPPALLLVAAAAPLPVQREFGTEAPRPEYGFR